MESFTEYQRLATATAIFPTDIALQYCTLGLCGESGEVAEKIRKLTLHEDSYVQLKRELGDVMWYFSQLCRILSLDIEDIISRGVQERQIDHSDRLSDCSLDLCSSCGSVAETVKKIIRDNNGEINDDRKKKIDSSLVLVIKNMMSICHNINTELLEVCAMNIKKLYDRKDRNVLNGSGDNR